MGAMASQITSLTIVYATVCSGADLSKHGISASLAFVWGIHRWPIFRWPVNSPHKWPVTGKMFPFDDVIMGLCFWKWDFKYMVLWYLVWIMQLLLFTECRNQNSGNKTRYLQEEEPITLWPILLTESGWSSFEFMACISNFIHIRQYHAITYPREREKTPREYHSCNSLSIP